MRRRSRPMLARFACALLVTALASVTALSTARAAEPANADDTAYSGDPPRDGPAPLPRGARIGLVPGIGVGMAGFTNVPSPLPSFVGYSVSQLEITAELPRVGLFARALWNSSGDDGRWTAPGGALGASYRFFGDGESTWSLVARGGLLYERWHASTGGCPIPFFFPDNCKDFGPKQLSGVITAQTPVTRVTVDTLGLLAGARLELPVRWAFMALGGEIASVADFSDSSPGAAFQAQLTFSISFRAHESGEEPALPSLVEPAVYNPRNR